MAYAMPQYNAVIVCQARDPRKTVPIGFRELLL